MARPGGSFVGRRVQWYQRLAVAAALAAVLGCGPPAPQPPPVAQNPLSLGQGGAFGNQSTSAASVSADGRWAAFASAADNLVPGDTNGMTDVFLRDRVTGTVRRVAESTSSPPRVSANGRYVSFIRQTWTIGVYDRITGTSNEWAATVSNAVSPVVPGDGSAAIYGAYSSFGIFSPACRIRDLTSGAEQDCPHGGSGYGTVAYETVSSNGRFVLYYWNDQNGGGTSARLLLDRTTGDTEVVTAPVISFGGGTSVSDDGRFLAAVLFQPPGPLTAVVHDLALGTTATLPVTPDGNTLPVDLSVDGSRVLVLSEATNLVPDDTNAAPDLFVWDVGAGVVSKISRTVDGADLPMGAMRCGQGPGQLLASGSSACALTYDAVVPLDSNTAQDAYLVP